jgi:hypothetical protein
MKHRCFTPENENLFVGARHASPLQKGVFHGKACGYRNQKVGQRTIFSSKLFYHEDE